MNDKKLFTPHFSLLTFYVRYLALDWGTKHIGLAKGDDETRIAFPSGIMHNTKNVMRDLGEVCAKEHVGGIVVGVPKTLRGGYGAQAQEVLKFVEQVKKALTLPVFLEDERFTTKLAAKVFGQVRRTHADAIAASLILQSFFDRQRQQRKQSETGGGDQ